MSEQTKEKHPPSILYKAKESIRRDVNLDIGGGKTFSIAPGSMIRASKPYEGQLGGEVVLVQPLGSEDGDGARGSSTFTLTVQELNRHFSRADADSPEIAHAARDSRNNKNYARIDGSPGRRGMEKFAANDNAESDQQEKPMVRKEQYQGIENMHNQNINEQDSETIEYTDLAIGEDVINFKQMVRDRLDAMAHQAIQDQKNEMLNAVEESYEVDTEQLDEQEQQIVEEEVALLEFYDFVDSLDEQQLQEYAKSLNDEDLELLEQLLVERAKKN